MKTPNYVFDDELYHHGIPGQRWGHRRFQNEDGSWTAAGRERYGEGEGPRQAAKPKVDARAKARTSFENKKYKMYMKSKEQRLKDKIAAKEERNRVREAAKTERLARKEQAKIDKKMAVLKGTKLGKTKNMSDDDLQTAINRLKLEVEYNKNYAIASKPNSALARADRFFEGPTGQVVKAVAVATIPKVAEQFVSKTLESNLKYANKLDRDKQIADIKKQKADTEKVNAETRDKIQSTRNAKLESQNKIRLENEKAAQEKLNSDREFEQQKVRDQNEYKINKGKTLSEVATARSKAEIEARKQTQAEDLQKAQQARLDADNQAKIDRENKKSEQELKFNEARTMGFRDKQNWWHKGTIELESDRARLENEKEKFAIQRLTAVDDNLRQLVDAGKISGDTFAKTITSIKVGDVSASISRSQANTDVKDINISKDDFVSKQDASGFMSKFMAGKSIKDISESTGYSESTIRRYLFPDRYR